MNHEYTLFDHFVLKRTYKWRFCDTKVAVPVNTQVLWKHLLLSAEAPGWISLSLLLASEYLLGSDLVVYWLYPNECCFVLWTVVLDFLWFLYVLWISMELGCDRSYWLSCHQLTIVWTEFFLLFSCHSAVEYILLLLVALGCTWEALNLSHPAAACVRTSQELSAEIVCECRANSWVWHLSLPVVVHSKLNFQNSFLTL